MAMSKAATAVPDPADDDAATGADDTGADAGGDEGEDQGGPTVLLTVMNNHDGTYTLIQGDEDEDGRHGDRQDTPSSGSTCRGRGSR